MKRCWSILLLVVVIPMLLFAQTNQPPVKRYVVTLELRQSHFSLDPMVHIKDHYNAITFEVPVDKQYYNSVKVGDKLVDKFRTASLILSGSFGDWEITVKSKREA